MTLTAGAWILALLVLGSGAAAAQTRPEFEVASIKPHIGGQISLLDANAGAGRPRVQPGGRFEGDRITVEQLLWFAYDGLREYQFLGLPDWGRTDRFVITATAPSNSSIDQVRLMVRSLLQDRFKMSAHMESRDMQLHALVFAHPDAALGPGVFRLDSCSGEAVRELMRKFPEKFMSTSTAGGGHGGCSSAGFSDLAVQLTAWLQVPFAVSVARLAERDGTPPDPTDPRNVRYVAGQQLYIDTYHPAERADLVIDNSG